MLLGGFLTYLFHVAQKEYFWDQTNSECFAALAKPWDDHTTVTSSLWCKTLTHTIMLPIKVSYRSNQ